ncbi:nitroreductase [Rhodococcus ruber]|uniref:Nitroreductase n=1 Tax=Rhodococcus ruber TaxID=1830 RepID=A0ABT4MG77_9NOCA|nr:nitroreductase [Rhodococcus ruber]MCZ4519430.1 nitroreductase [Rhodococcus ruber]
MSVRDALTSRRSVRAFRPDPIPTAIVESLLELASSAPSNSNTQPWRVHVVTGAAKAALTAALLTAHDNPDNLRQRDYEYQPNPEDWCEPLKSRRRRFGETLYSDVLGIDSEDTPARVEHHRRNYDFFGAPVGIILTVNRHALDGALIDAGLFLQALMIAARAAGLDTCPQASFIDFSPTIRTQLDIDIDQRIVCGLALGHADGSNRLSRCMTTRQPVSTFTRFHSS